MHTHEKLEELGAGGRGIATGARNGSFQLISLDSFHSSFRVSGFANPKKLYLKSYEVNMVRCKHSALTTEYGNECLL